MNPVSPLLRLLISLILVWGSPSLSQGADSVPNAGSPYTNIGDIEIGQILHLPTGTVVSREQMIDVVSGSRVIYIGETHDNLEAHRVQLEVLQALHRKYPGKIAVGMEMFRRSAQPELNHWLSGDLDPRSFRKLFRKNWGMGFKLYQPIFEYMQENHIPLLGLKSTRETESKLREGGFEQEGLPEIDTSDSHHKAYAMALFGSHDAPEDQVFKPYQMLLLWEESMAETVAEFLKDDRYPDHKLVVLAGGFHVQYGFGIPKRAFRRVPHAYSIILPTVTEIPAELKDREMKFENVAIPLYSSDFAWRLDYKVPPQRKIRLGVMLEETEHGLKVLEVLPNSNAANLGIVKDDHITRLNGSPVIDTEDLSDHLQKNEVGDTVRVTLLRDGRAIEVEGVLQPSPNPHRK